MDINLNEIEIRVIGALMEKEMTTPDYYPLTLNALVSACNQKSNRHPVMDLDKKTVAKALDRLCRKELVWEKSMAGSRVLKYAHRMRETFNLSPKEAAVICLLFLRGPQTSGELKSRSARMCRFADTAEVEKLLTFLSQRENGPFVVSLPRRAGQRETRYAHLFSGEIDLDEQAEVQADSDPLIMQVRADDEKIAELERKVDALSAELNELKNRFAEFTKQFE